MKVLFLDVDGVLNNELLLETHGWEAIGETKLDLLKEIIDATEAKIVLSSTWRIDGGTRKVLVEKLETRTLQLFDQTIVLMPKKMSMSVNRSDEICEWLSRHPEVEHFAVLDDNTDAGYGIESHFFKTQFEEGLTRTITNQVIAHLTKGNA